MARIAGRNGRFNMSISGGAPVPVAFMKQWTIDFTVDQFDVTAFGDTNKAYVTGLPDVKGTFNGFFDNATDQTLPAALDGVARACELYWDVTGSSTSCFKGNAFLDYSVDTSVDGAITVAGNFVASGPWVKSG